MQSARLWARLLGLERVVVEGVEFDEDDECVVVSVWPRKATKRRCGECGRRCPGYDRGEGRRRWRALDLGRIRAFLEADSPRVRCAEHGVVVAQVPWARHGAGHTYAFDDTCSWLVTHRSRSAVRELLRVAWCTVGSIVTRVVADAEAATGRFANLRRIGIDEWERAQAVRQYEDIRVAADPLNPPAHDGDPPCHTRRTGGDSDPTLDARSMAEALAV